ncbi:MAG: hypothetical protein IJD04_06880, partial [Desulfovibrionaceae bacterium]|nr:hypothetical protein [Desulfovibrionaceae bacterium]
MKLIKFLAASVGVIAIVLAWCSNWVSTTFGDVYFEQALWHIIYSPITDADPKYLGETAKTIVSGLFLSCLWVFVVYHNILLKFIKKIFNRLCSGHPALHNSKTFIFISDKLYHITSVAMLLSAAVFCIGVLIHTESNFKIYEYMTTPVNYSRDFIAEHYFIPDSTDIHFERKNSLVIVSVESLENSFFHSDLDRSYL